MSKKIAERNKKIKYGSKERRIKAAVKIAKEELESWSNDLDNFIMMLENARIYGQGN